MTTTASSLVHAARMDIFPNYPAQVDYGFVNCKDGTNEDSMLLGVYQGLIKIIGCNEQELHAACIKGKLAELITQKYEQGIKDGKFGSSIYYEWFKMNKDKVKNPYPF
jgi:hypothetical protein